MNAPVKSQDFLEPLSRPNFRRRLLRSLGTIFSSPKGDQVGWEGGARGFSRMFASDLPCPMKKQSLGNSLRAVTRGSQSECLVFHDPAQFSSAWYTDHDSMIHLLRGEQNHARSPIPTNSASPFSLSWSVHGLRKRRTARPSGSLGSRPLCGRLFGTSTVRGFRKLSAVELERRGIARGDFHRHAADAFPKWHPRA